jgi:hypothetical protein
MSIRNRLEDAELLWKSGRLEGAFVLALIAVAATSRRVFPYPIGDQRAFEDFPDQGLFRRMSAEFRGELHQMRHIFYKWFRCNLIHEGELPLDVEIIPDPKPGTLSVRAGGAPVYILQVSQGWFRELANTVIHAEVNRDLFPGSGTISTLKN